MHAQGWAAARRRTAAVAVVGRGEDGDHVLLVAPIVALHHQLVRPRHQVQPVGVVELHRYECVMPDIDTTPQSWEAHPCSASCIPTGCSTIAGGDFLPSLSASSCDLSHETDNSAARADASASGSSPKAKHGAQIGCAMLSYCQYGRAGSGEQQGLGFREKQAAAAAPAR